MPGVEYQQQCRRRRRRRQRHITLSLYVKALHKFTYSKSTPPSTQAMGVCGCLRLFVCVIPLPVPGYTWSVGQRNHFEPVCGPARRERHTHAQKQQKNCCLSRVVGGSLLDEEMTHTHEGTLHSHIQRQTITVLRHPTSNVSMHRYTAV